MKFIFAVIVAILSLVALALAGKAKHCSLPPATGEGCQSFNKQYYWDSKTNSCKTFEYGGCGGNGNRFDTQELCEKACK